MFFVINNVIYGTIYEINNDRIYDMMEVSRMAVIRPFACVRPVQALASQIAALPYDVYNRSEACEVVKNNPKSFLKVDRAETAFGDDVDTYDDRVYTKAGELLTGMIVNGEMIKDDEPGYYIYELTMDGRAQTGIAACASIDDYADGVIKKHENTRADKEQDRIRHVDACGAHTGPIFLAYRANAVIDEIVGRNKQNAPLYDFKADDGVRHAVWKISDVNDIDRIRDAFAAISEIYIADGHHRAASAVKVGFMRREAHPDYDGTEEFNFFLSVLFPDEELMIMDYNRVVKDLNGYEKAVFLDKLRTHFTVEDAPFSPYRPERKGTFGMYLDGKWYRLTAKQGIVSDDPVEGLDVSVLQNALLGPVLGIGDPKTDKRIDFVGGIRGLHELERRTQTDMRIAFSMYPTSIAELFAVADAGRLMPPKSTWFEPKLRSGLFIHQF